MAAIEKNRKIIEEAKAQGKEISLEEQKRMQEEVQQMMASQMSEQKKAAANKDGDAVDKLKAEVDQEI